MGIKVVGTNRKARHFYEVLETVEAGMELVGTEVKSLREGKVSLVDSYAGIKNDEIILFGLHIAPYEQGNIFNREPRRPRKLLLHKREIKRYIGAITRKGLTLIPLKVYFNERGFAKVELALAKGKRVIDRREDIKRRDQKRDMQREFKGQKFKV